MLEINVQWNPLMSKFQCYVLKDGGYIASPLSLAKLDTAGWADPTMVLSPEEAQYIADQLWNAGIRPAGSKQSQGAFDAQGRHLEDMRCLVFKHKPSK